MPDTGALADYVSAAEMDAHLRSVLEKADDGNIRFMHIGFHQETADRFVNRIADCVAKWQDNASIEFRTLEQAADLAKAEFKKQAANPTPAKIFPTDKWPTSTLQDEGFDPKPIQELVDDMRNGKYGLIDHFLMIRNGKIVADHHFQHDYEQLSKKYHPVDDQYDYDHPSWHPYYQGSDLHTLQSVTKSVTSLAIGIAIDQGLIPDGVETPAMSFFQDYKLPDDDARRKAIRLHDMLTMRSGIDWNEMMSYDDDRNSCIQLEACDDWVQFVLNQPMREKPGTRYDYNSGVSVLLGKVVDVASGKRIDQFLKENLFEPIGIYQFYWKETPNKEMDTEGGLYLTPHDMARICYLVLNKGQWNGKRIVSQEWIEQSTAPIVEDIIPNNGRVDQGYGFQWWVPEHKNNESKIVSGSGYGGQFPMIIPEYDLIIVFNAWNIHDVPEMSAQAAVRERILPAIQK